MILLNEMQVGLDITECHVLTQINPADVMPFVNLK